jgi:type IX secretion system PorP/SprF family membrane protein
MIRMKKTLFILGIAIVGQIKAQDPVFNQYLQSGIYFNPALAGSANTVDKQPAVRVGTQYRNQWGRELAMNTALLHYDQSIGSNYSNMGFYVLNDIAGTGTFTTTQANAVYAYQTPFKGGKWAAQYGLSLGYRNQGINAAKLRFEDQIDYTQGTVRNTTEIIPANRKGNADVGAGAVLFSRYFQVGLAVHNITKPVYDYIGTVENRIPRRYTLHSGGLIVLRDIDKAQYTALSIQGMAMVQGPFSQANLSVALVNNDFSFGIGHRRAWFQAKNADAITINLGCNIKSLRLNYSFEQTISQLSAWSPRTHELGLSFRLNKTKFPAPRRISVPM